MKYGTKGIIPEFVNIGALGCVGIKLADGTMVCCRAAKNSFQALLNWAEDRTFIGSDQPSGALPVPQGPITGVSDRG
jgi:hypothetical protein